MNIQQHRSLQGRWYNRPSQLGAAPAENIVIRGRIMKAERKFWLIIALFKKGYGKFRLVEAVPVTDIGVNNIRLHAVLVKQSAMSQTYPVVIPDMNQLESVKECFLNITANKVDQLTESFLDCSI